MMITCEAKGVHAFGGYYAITCCYYIPSEVIQHQNLFSDINIEIIRRKVHSCNVIQYKYFQSKNNIFFLEK